MAVTQLVLLGVPAFVGSVLGSTRVRFFIDENDFDPNRMIEVDLAKNPQTVQPGAWATDVECDFQTTGGLTTIGPTFHAGAHVGAVYLAQRLVTQYANVLSNWPPPPDDAYQYQALLRSNNGTVFRFHGFKARVLGAPSGSLARVALFRVGGTAPAGPPQWIDLSDPDVCDPPANGFTAISPSSPPGAVGALFLSSKVVPLDGPQYPKIPRNLGW